MGYVREKIRAHTARKNAAWAETNPTGRASLRARARPSCTFCGRPGDGGSFVNFDPQPGAKGKAPRGTDGSFLFGLLCCSCARASGGDPSAPPYKGQQIVDLTGSPIEFTPHYPEEKLRFRR